MAPSRQAIKAETPSALATDLYELTMAAAYFANEMRGEATFELFVRSLPSCRSFLVTAGLAPVLDFLAAARFDDEAIDYLRNQEAFRGIPSSFFDYLREWRFSGDVWAMPEGTVAFAEEPLLRVTAPMVEAQIVETFLLSTIGFQTMIASKAARVVHAAAGRDVIEFGTRRAHGFDAGTWAARAAFIGGCRGTSNVMAAQRFDIPVFGTQAHSYIMAFGNEQEAFRSFLDTFPRTATILVDTYDTLAAVKQLAETLGSVVPAVRLDSGDLLTLSVQVREILDAHDMQNTRIFASNELNESRIAALIGKGAPIDGFGVGTELATSADAPNLGIVYKLVAYAGAGRLKLSDGKAGYPQPKQVWRGPGSDLVAAVDEPSPGSAWRPLLIPVMLDGMNVGQPPTLPEIREHAAIEMRQLPEAVRALENAASYPVRYSDTLEQQQKEWLDDRGPSCAAAG